MKKIIVFGLIAMLLCFAVPAFAKSGGNHSAIGIEAGLPAPGESVFAVSLGEKEVATPLVGGTLLAFPSCDLLTTPMLSMKVHRNARNDTLNMFRCRYPPGRPYHRLE